MDWTLQDLIMMHMVNWYLVTVRVHSFLQGAPFFGSSTLPGTIKVFVSATISTLIYLSPVVDPMVAFPSFGMLVFLTFKELLIGLTLAYVSQLVYLPLRLMGMMVGRSSGFGRGFLINPDDEDKSTLVQNFVYIIGALLFFTLDGHHIIVRAAAITFQWIPLGGWHMNPLTLQVISNYFSEAFNLGVQWAAPIMGCILIGTFSFGILGKSVPQMNLLIMDLPVRVVVGMMGIGLAIPYIVVLYEKFIFQTAKTYNTLILLMSGA